MGVLPRKGKGGGGGGASPAIGRGRYFDFVQSPPKIKKFLAQRGGSKVIASESEGKGHRMAGKNVYETVMSRDSLKKIRS